MIRYFSPDSSECSRLSSVAHSTYSGIDSSSRPMNSATVFCAAASSDMPPSEVSSSAWNSPCAASRAASERHASSTVQAPPAIRTRFSTSARSSMRSAPETIDFSASHCQIVSPSAAASAPRLSAGTSCARTQLRAEQPEQQHDAPRRPSSAISGESPAKSTCGPFRCVVAVAEALSRGT